MLSVFYAECHVFILLSWVLFMLSAIMLSVIMLIVVALQQTGTIYQSNLLQYFNFSNSRFHYKLRQYCL